MYVRGGREDIASLRQLVIHRVAPENPPTTRRKSRKKVLFSISGRVERGSSWERGLATLSHTNTHFNTHHLSSFISVSGLELLLCALATKASSYLVNKNSNCAWVPDSKKVHVFNDAMITVLLALCVWVRLGRSTGNADIQRCQTLPFTYPAKKRNFYSQ